MALDPLTSQRQIRFGEVIRSLISECILRADFYDNEISMTSITVSFVRMSKDLKIANIYFMPLGGKFKDQLLELRLLPCVATVFCQQCGFSFLLLPHLPNSGWARLKKEYQKRPLDLPNA